MIPVCMEFMHVLLQRPVGRLTTQYQRTEGGGKKIPEGNSSGRSNCAEDKIKRARCFHSVLLWCRGIVMMRFLFQVQCFLVPPPPHVPLFALTLPRRALQGLAVADALFGTANIDLLLFRSRTDCTSHLSQLCRRSGRACVPKECLKRASPCSATDCLID
jgi:hypothetical protein